MNNNNTHITLKEIIDSLVNENQREIIFTKLKKLDPVDDEVKGVKLFLENNNYDYKLLQDFINTSKPNFNTLSEEKKGVKVIPNWLKYAAILIPFIGIAYYSIFIKNDISKTLYTQYYEKDVGLPVTMDLTKDILYNESMNAFRDDDFKEALNGFELLMKSNPTNDTILYYSGCAKMELGKLNNAILDFQKITSNTKFREKSEYRLALLHIKNKNFNSAKQILEKIKANKNHLYNTKAIKILKEEVFNN